jgi:hypothetical protein
LGIALAQRLRKEVHQISEDDDVRLIPLLSKLFQDPNSWGSVEYYKFAIRGFQLLPRPAWNEGITCGGKDCGIVR